MPNSSPQTPVDGIVSVPVPALSSGGTDSEYKLLVKHEVTRDGHTMTYYTGRRIFRNKKEDKITEKDACFLVVGSFDEAGLIYKLSRSISHSRLMSALSYFFHAGDGDGDGVPLVCFDPFEVLDTAKAKNADLKDPKLISSKVSSRVRSNIVPGNPNRVVQDEIRGLAEGLAFMHTHKVSSSWLALSSGYVWCGEMVKILVADTSLDLKIEKDNRMIKKDHIEALKRGIGNYLLQTVDAWDERDKFLLSCMHRSVNDDRRLQMIIQHPFLQKTIDDILQFFSRVAYALNAGTEYNGQTLFNYENVINSLSGTYCVGIHGWKKDANVWRGEFETTFKGANYSTNKMRQLIRLLRNMYEHLWQSMTMNREQFLLAIRRYWPSLIEELHMRIYS